MSDLKALTVLVTTSPIPSHPSTAMISRVLGSVARFVGRGYKVVIACDGCAGSEEEKRRCEAYKSLLRRFLSDRFYEAERHVHQAGTVRRAIEKVDTEFLLLLEHDWEIIRPVETEGILRALEKYSEVKFVRLNGRMNREEGWDRILDKWHREGEVPLLRTSCWSGNPHFSTTETYKNLVIPLCSDGRALEHCVMDSPGNGWDDLSKLGFEKYHRKWGTFLYGDFGHPAVVKHLDGKNFSAGTVTPADAMEL